MENSKVKQNKKGKNKGKKNVIQPEVTHLYNSWNNRISSLRVWNEAIISAGEQAPEAITTTILTKESETLKGVQPQQAATSTDAPQPASKPEVAPQQDGAAPKGSSQQAATPEDIPQKVATAKDLPQVATTNVNATNVAPKDVVLKILRRTEILQPGITLKVASPKVSGQIGAPQQAATPKDSGSAKDAPQKVATTKGNANVVPKDVPLKGATSKVVKVVRWKDLQQDLTIKVAPQQAAATPENTPSGAAQQICEASEMIRGPIQRKTLWKAPPPYRTVRDASPKVSGQIGGPQQAAATPECVSPPSGAAQQAGEASKLTRGPVQRKTLWKPSQPHREPKQKGLARVWAGKVEADCYKRGPVQRKELWTPTPPSPKEHSGRDSDYWKPHWTAPQFSLMSKALSSEAKASGDEASDFISCLMQQKNICTAPQITQACEEVEASSQHAMTVDPEPQPLQLSSHEKEINTLKEENEALRSSLQQASCEKEENNKLKEENKALTAEVEQLKEELKENNVLHDEANQKNVKKISDLEVQLLFKMASEANTRHKKEQMEEALQRQKESQKETEVYLAEQREENHALMVKLAQALSNLESQQLQWQEERTRLLQSLSDIQDTLQEKTCSGVKEETDDQGEATLSQPKGNTKQKRPSLWRRFLRMFK